ncbi:hypothetical protein LX70_00582 [Defluviimonas denitrificans]|jgi:hypothetical protein|uniref:Uncharacterized protein n=1 Tax=Albidovulum denitrificans TaxID=404881 RepID=A0A2S8SDE2_9RHOB|nr:hypothetical protein [Defluviimonas denitrificans]PQV58769.1 hypothetical protein LX70_00582 [Defluviimonas denitrificans]
MTRERFLNAAKILLNIDKDELEAAGVLTPGAVGGSDWTRFNDEPLIFLVKLPDDRYARLWQMIEARQPKQKKPGSSFHAALTVERLIRIKDHLSNQKERDAINEAVAAIYKLEEVSA